MIFADLGEMEQGLFQKAFPFRGRWLAEGETEEVRNPCPFPANISVKKFVTAYKFIRLQCVE